MPILIALIAVIGTVYFYTNRARQARDVVEDVTDMAQTAAGAVRRFQYRRKANVHPADGIEEYEVAASALLVAAARSDGALSRDEEHAILKQLQAGTGMMLNDAREAMALATWIVDQGKGPDEMTRRLVRRAVALADQRQVEVLVGMLSALNDVTDPEGPQDIIERIARQLR